MNSEHKLLIIFCFTLLLIANLVIAEYSKPAKHKGLSGINVGHALPKIKYVQIGIPSQLVLKTSKQQLLKQKSTQLLGSKNKQISNTLITREQLLQSFQIQKKHGPLQ